MRAPASDLPVMLRDVSVRIGAVTLLDAVSVALHAGAPTAILGPNGAGKTTLLRTAMGLLAPTNGTVSWGGRTDPAGGRRAIVFQRPVMLRRTAAANLAFALPKAMPRRARNARIAELLTLADLADHAQRPARKLSGGEQQRLALARALARDPELLFLDEPANNLDPAAVRRVEAIIRDVAASGIKVVMATHDLGQARRLAAEVYFLVRGRVLEHATAERFFTAPATPEAAAFQRGDIVDITDREKTC